MFTGLIHEVGRVLVEPYATERGGKVLELEHTEELSQRLEIGASLAVSGVCLTLIEHRPGRSHLEMSEETLRLTSLDSLGPGSSVNLEPALRLGDPLGGHWVQGHVDGTTTVHQVEPEEDFSRMSFILPRDLSRYFVVKGSITVDGVSLTVASLTAGDRPTFDVALIPHTLENTTLGGRTRGDEVNLEVDVLAKYVERAVLPWSPSSPGS